MSNSVLIIIASLLVLLLGRVLYFQSKIAYLSRVRRIYDDYIKSVKVEKNNEIIDPNLKEKLLREKSETVRLLKGAEISDQSEQFMRLMDLGYAYPKKIVYLDNIHRPDPNIVSFYVNVFPEAIGYYQKRRNESISPFFWFNFIINFPKYAFSFYGGKPKGSFYNLIDIIYKLIIVSGALYGILKKLNIFQF
jgi:hypothetical protein